MEKCTFPSPNADQAGERGKTEIRQQSGQSKRASPRMICFHLPTERNSSSIEFNMVKYVLREQDLSDLEIRRNEKEKVVLDLWDT